MRENVRESVFMFIVMVGAIILFSACAPQVVVVTATPLPSTNVPTNVPTNTPRPAAPTLPGPITPTREVWGAHRTCVETNPEIFDPVDGCNITKNGTLNRGAEASLLGVDQPRYWAATVGTIPVACTNGSCTYNLTANPHFFTKTLYTQTLSNVEAGQCYMAKITMAFRLMGTVKSFPENLLFGSFNGILDTVVKGTARQNTGDANFWSGRHESFWVVLGGNNPTPTVELGIQRQFPSLQNGSTITIDGLLVFPVDKGYCRDVTIQLD